jgi:CBS domain-containing protein
MEKWHVGSLIVVRDDRPIGIITDRDLALGVLGARRDPAGCTVADLMTREPVVLGMNYTPRQAAELMKRTGLRKLPLVDEQGRAVGVVTADDLILSLGQRAQALSEIVRRQLRNEALPPSTASRCFGRE